MLVSITSSKNNRYPANFDRASHILQQLVMLEWKLIIGVLMFTIFYILYYHETTFQANVLQIIATYDLLQKGYNFSDRDVDGVFTCIYNKETG